MFFAVKTKFYHNLEQENCHFYGINHGGAGTKMSDTMLTNWFMGGQDTHPPISTLY